MRIAVGLMFLAVLATNAPARAQNSPNNGRVEQDLERISSAADYDWLRRPGRQPSPGDATPPTSDEKEGSRFDRDLPEGPDADCGYGPAPPSKPDKRLPPAQDGKSGGCGKRDHKNEDNGCGRYAQPPSCEGCGPTAGCSWGQGTPGCGAAVGPVTGYMLGGLLLAAVLALLLFAFFRRTRRQPFEVHTLDLKEARPEDVRLSLLPEARLHDMLARAEASAAAGDFKAAVGWCYLGGLAVLHRMGSIDLRHSTTNLELLETVKRRGGKYEETRLLVRTFEEIFFGARPALEKHYRDCRDVVENRLA